MKPYNVMIVDDEAEVREGIAEQIAWTSIGFSLVAQAENGLEALEKAESVDVDVLLTDIKMPFMDGLTMAKEFRTLHPSAKVILFTGFDDMDYARQAIRLNVLEYVLKPVNAGELTQVLLRAKARLDEEKKQKQDVEALRSSYEKTFPLRQDQYLREILSGGIPPSSLEQLISHYAIPIDTSKEMIVAAFDANVPVPPNSAITQDLLPTSVRQLLTGTLQGKCIFAMYTGLLTVVAVACWEQDPVDNMMIAANEVCAECRSLFGVEISAGVGRRCSDASLLHESLTEAQAALEYKWVSGAGKAIYIRDVEQTTRHPNLLDSRYEHRLINAVKFGTDAQIEADIDEMFDGFSGAQPGEWKYRTYVTGILNVIIQIVARYALPAEEIMGEEGAKLFHSGDETDPAALKKQIVDICTRIGGYMNKRRSSMAGKLVEDAKQFILDNYRASELSLESVCCHLHISQSYFSDIFKKDTGKSFVRYLTDLRMEHALDLLRTGSEKTYVIAGMVGYEEPNYFSYVFKKKFGLSPSQYRQERS